MGRISNGRRQRSVASDPVPSSAMPQDCCFCFFSDFYKHNVKIICYQHLNDADFSKIFFALCINPHKNKIFLSRVSKYRQNSSSPRWLRLRMSDIFHEIFIIIFFKSNMVHNCSWSLNKCMYKNINTSYT